MKFGSTFYQSKKVSTCEIAGAVALCAVHDLRVNLFRFSGFPQIVVQDNLEGFQVTVSISDEPPREASFMLSKDEAFKAAKRFQSKATEYDDTIFDRVQDALAKVVG
jgi:hypothetical protein